MEFLLEYTYSTLLLASTVQQSDSATRIHNLSPLDFLPIWVTTEHWTVFPMLYSRFSLVFYFVHSINSVYTSIPVSQSGIEFSGKGPGEWGSVWFRQDGSSSRCPSNWSWHGTPGLEPHRWAAKRISWGLDLEAEYRKWSGAEQEPTWWLQAAPDWTFAGRLVIGWNWVVWGQQVRTKGISLGNAKNLEGSTQSFFKLKT